MAKNKDYGYAGYAAGISTISAIVAGEAATKAFDTQVSSQRSVDLLNVKNLTGSYEVTYNKNVEQINAINQALGSKLSERGLQAMKEEALLRVAAAETGTVGGTTEGSINEAFMNEAFDKANIVAAAETQVVNVMTGMALQENQTRNQIDSMLLGGGVRVDTNSTLAAIAGGLNVGMQTFGLLSQQEKVNAFGIAPKPTGE